MSHEPAYKAFMSYTRRDNEYSGGLLTEFRDHLQREVQAQTGRDFAVFQDIEGIKWGQPFRKRIKHALEKAIFLIPIITPTFFQSEFCRQEMRLFLKREQQLGRNDLILPVYFIDCPRMEDPSLQASDDIAQIIAERQYIDWRDLRFQTFDSPETRKALAHMASHIRDAMERVHYPLDTDRLGQDIDTLARTVPPEEVVEPRQQRHVSSDHAAPAQPAQPVGDVAKQRARSTQHTPAQKRAQRPQQQAKPARFGYSAAWMPFVIAGLSSIIVMIAVVMVVMAVNGKDDLPGPRVIAEPPVPAPTPTDAFTPTPSEAFFQVINKTGQTLDVTITGPVEQSWTVAAGEPFVQTIPTGAYEITAKLWCGSQQVRYDFEAGKEKEFTYNCRDKSE